MDQQISGVSVVVPTLNRGLYLIDTLHDLLAQEHRPLEVLIVDQSSDENMALVDLVSKYRDLVSHHRVSFRGLTLARNYGWQNAKYDAIVFVDDDVRCGPRLVEEHLRTLMSTNCGMVAGGIDERHPREKRLAGPGRFNLWTANPTRGFDASGETRVDHVPGGNFSAWRLVLEKAGGFDEALACGGALYEETELCLRVRQCGFDIYFNGNARLQHLAAGSGGCRVPDVSSYLRSLGHNRAIVIQRHLRWYQAPTAWLYLLLLFISYTVHYRRFSALREGLRGMFDGIAAANQPPLCGQYKTENASQEMAVLL